MQKITAVSCFKINLVRLRKSVLDGLKDKTRLRQKINDEKQCKRKNVADENMLSNEKETRQKNGKILETYIN